jgi:REP element-mobilizing transposase RayT
MSDGYQILDQYATYYLTLTIVDWVDVLTRRIYKDIIIDSLDYCIKSKGLKLYGYVIMSNHIHLIAGSSTGKLSDTIRDFKKFTANTIIHAINTEPESRREWMMHRFEWNASLNKRTSIHQFWTHENHAVSVFSLKFFNQKLNYIHLNPVRAGWVLLPEHYIYSSANAIINNVPGLLPLEDWHI